MHTGYYFHWHPSSVWLSTALYVLYHVLGHGIATILIGSFLSIAVIKYPNNFVFNIKDLSLLQAGFIVLSLFFFQLKVPIPINVSAIIIGLLLITAIQNGKSIFNTFFNLSWIRYIGVLSFSLYIWQQIFTKQQPWAKSFPYANSIFLNMVALAIVAMCSYHLYELQFLKLKKRFSQVK